MSKAIVPYALVALILTLLAALSAPARAEFFGCDDQHHAARHVSYSHARSYARAGTYTREFAAASRPHVIIRPWRNAKRHCRAWLSKEYRLSGTVIVPHERCWWQ